MFIPPFLADWFQAHSTLLVMMGVFSIIAFFGTLLLLPVLIIRIPEDYFLKMDLTEKCGKSISPPALFLKAAKNLAGIILVLAGLAMLILPGQGILTLFIGVLLMDFPGKRALLLSLIRNKSILRGINYIRIKANRPPLNIYL